MAKKIVKKKKLRIFRLFLLLFILAGFVFGVYFYLQLPVFNLVVKNTTYLNDDYILELANLKDYPKFYFSSKKNIEKRVMKSPYIRKIDVKCRFFHTYVLSVVENRPLFFNETSQCYVFEDQKEVEKSLVSNPFRVPRLINYVPDDKYSKFIKGMKNIQDDILGEISDIEYVPNDYDKERFLLYMDDGNMVYLTLTKFNMIHYYHDVYRQLEGRKGILYLDNGNHFQIKE